MTLYPNPAKDQLTVDFETIIEEPLTLIIRSMNGEVLQTIVSEEASRSVLVDVSRLADGVYSLEAKGTTFTMNTRFVVIK